MELHAEWKGMTPLDRRRQTALACSDMGRRGLIVERLHGGPYALCTLVPELYAGSGSVTVTGRLLRSRLPATLEVLRRRHIECSSVTRGIALEQELLAYEDFVSLCEQKGQVTLFLR